MSGSSLEGHRLHILGASGAGTTTLGRLLAQHYQLTPLDTDDFYWEKTTPPYQTPRPVERRLDLLSGATRQHQSWVLSGSLCGWGDPLIPLFSAVIFVTLPAEIRLARTLKRERKHYGHQIELGGAMHQQHLAFMQWSAGYDNPYPTVGRSRQRHETWLTALPCPVLRVANTGTPQQMLSAVITGLDRWPERPVV